MKHIRLILFVASLILCPGIRAQEGGWNGIVPLHSTRKDVERLLGPGNQGCKCHYQTGDYNIFVQYSEKPCSDFRDPGWRVPEHTVINISVYPKATLRFSDLKVDTAKYVKTADPEIKGVFYYFNEHNGTTIVVDEGIVSEFGYGPAKRDDGLRCPSKKKTRAHSISMTTTAEKGFLVVASAEPCTAVSHRCIWSCKGGSE